MCLLSECAKRAGGNVQGTQPHSTTLFFFCTESSLGKGELRNFGIHNPWTGCVADVPAEAIVSAGNSKLRFSGGHAISYCGLYLIP